MYINELPKDIDGTYKPFTAETRILLGAPLNTDISFVMIPLILVSAVKGLYVPSMSLGLICHQSTMIRQKEKVLCD
jgi:hypothetical protein